MPGTRVKTEGEGELGPSALLAPPLPGNRPHPNSCLISRPCNLSHVHTAHAHAHAHAAHTGMNLVAQTPHPSANPTPYTLHPTPYTLHPYTPTPYTPTHARTFECVRERGPQRVVFGWARLSCQHVHNVEEGTPVRYLASGAPYSHLPEYDPPPCPLSQSPQGRMGLSHQTSYEQ
jgi:hypothetical protein